MVAVLPWGPCALIPCPGIVARAFPGLLTKRLEWFELFTAVAMATRVYQIVHLHGELQVLKTAFLNFFPNKSLVPGTNNAGCQSSPKFPAKLG